MNRNDNEKQVEILAPAGSYDIMTAVIQAGADAVYLGGDLFGARAFAGNFNEEELLRAIDYAHLHGRRIYLTVNTLLKEKELEDRLVDYLTPYYKAGLDAVIVQDFGVLREVRKHFPGLHIHASTQMAITGHNGAQMLQDAGATRIVTARELSQNEIKSIHDHCDIEIESFVHGALCYCYSGQCLFSSMNGGRSGNRGRCAQPCRMNYKVSDRDNRVNAADQEYVLSPKDMCALPILPDVIDAGVYSLKIEGRMKNVTYAAGVTSLYRKYVDLYLEKGRKGYHVSDQDMNDLMDLYNRGAFTSGYYQNAKGKEMLSLSRPNHMGTRALQVTGSQNGLITFRALERIYAQDVFEIDKENSFSSGKEYQTGETFQVNLPRRYRLKKGDILFRTRNNRILLDVNQRFVENRLKEPVSAIVTAKVGEPLSITMTHGAFSVTANGPLVEAAMKQPLSSEKIKSQFSKLGDTEFEMEQITVELEGDVFIPVGQMNELRRNAVEALQDKIVQSYRRTLPDEVEESVNALEPSGLAESEVSVETDVSAETDETRTCSILASSIKQAQYALTLEQVQTVMLQYTLLESDLEECKTIIQQGLEQGKLIVLALPHMLRDKNNARFHQLIQKAYASGIDTFLVRNMEEIGALAAFQKEIGTDADTTSAQKTLQLITDAGLYIWNSKAKEQLNDMIKEHGMRLLWVTLPFEETSREMSDCVRMESEQAAVMKKELVVFTKLPLMLSEQCVRKTFDRCDGSSGKITITDRKNKDYIVKSYCSYCYTVVYDQKWMNLTELQDEIDAAGADRIRYEFIDDTTSVETMQQILSGDASGDNTNGHFLLGVE